MNIEAYDAEALRKIVRLLEYENNILKDKLKKENIPYDEINPFEETIENAEQYDLDQGARIVNPAFIIEEMAIRFFSMFWGRVEKRYFTMSVKIKNGQSGMRRKSLHI